MRTRRALPCALAICLSLIAAAPAPDPAPTVDDLFLVIVRGPGAMRVGDAVQPVGAGSILYVPRSAVHAFANQSGAPAVSYAIYSPPFDGKDRIDVEARAK